MPLYEILPDRFLPVAAAELRAEGVRERGDLQRLLRDQIDIVAPDTLVIAEEFGDWEDSRRRIDLLALDREANLVVVELKTEEDGGHLELQALRYAAMVSTLTFEQACDAHRRYLQGRGLDGDPATRLLEFLGWSQPEEERFAADVRVVLVAPSFSREITSTVMWLNDRELDIRCIRVNPYKLDGRLLADVQQVIPLPEAEEYQVRVRQKGSEERAARRGHASLDSFWEELSAGRPPEEVAAARELHAWFSDNGFKPLATIRGMGGELRHGKASFYFFKVRKNGEVAIWLHYLSRRPPFADDGLREELRRRLCEIPGIDISPKRLSGIPDFPLAVLTDAAAMDQFKKVWEWALEQIRAMPVA